ncbi:hypothetical protein GM418_30100 [Maribellus comscasis]|uniref:Thiamine biosynthesis protein ThiF n=1 Tax=Maribellus comscasis TaxID=2681766 RepID=A0A6I6K5M1_9BACT|nr:ThiF family adenylyltransferase [Maribellus comscasis]QGY47762.1 hypothetical protein GM418_30100 [Maribellus comscasis]
MKYTYNILEGDEISFENLKLARARRVALAVQRHPYCISESVLYVVKKTGEEIIYLTFDNEIPEEPLNGIQAYEDVAIICHPDDQMHPEVYALRTDFKNGLTHTNVKLFEHPVSLCVTEQSFEEIRHLFNEYEFIESIRQWFSLTAEDKLHQEDQPLEAFFHPKGYAVLHPQFRPYEPWYLEQIGNSEMYAITNNLSDNLSFSLYYFEADPTLHGFIRREPKSVSDLDETITVSGIPFSEVVTNMLNFGLNDFSENKVQWSYGIAFLAKIPVLRNINDETPSKDIFLLFTSKNSILDLGQRSGCIDKAHDKWAPILFKKFDVSLVKNLNIELYSTMDDFSTLSAANYNNIEFNESSYFLVGAGALGSQVLNLFARMGYGKWFLTDHDTLFPHNIAKHVLGRNDVGFNKALRLAQQINHMVGSEMVVPFDKKFQDLEVDSRFAEIISKVEVIFDMSTSIAVARKLARDCNEITDAPRISSFLNPTGTDLVILAEDKQRMHRLDLLEMQYYRCLTETPGLQNHLKITSKEKIRYNRNSCREITNKINQTDVAIHASICAKKIQDIAKTGNASISIWKITNDTQEVKKYNFTPTHWTDFVDSGWNICVDDALIEKMHTYRETKLPNETGGILVGTVDNERKVVYLVDTIFAPIDSIEEETGFVRGTKGLIEEYRNYMEITDNQLMYLGEWHSHPKNCSTKPSNLDENLFEYLAFNLGIQGYPAVMCIIGDNNINLRISLNNE